MLERLRNLARRLTGKAKRDRSDLDMDAALDIADEEGDEQDWEEPQHREARRTRRGSKP
jgi:hypothetical protein